MTTYQVWAEAYPDPPSFSAWITAVEPAAVDEHGHSPVTAMTCVPRGRRDAMADMVEDLFRVFVELPDREEVVVHLTWLDEPPPALLEWLGE